LQAVEGVIHFDITGFRQPLADKFGTVISPRGEDRSFDVGVGGFRDSKDIPVVVVGCFNVIIPYVVLVRPHACEHVVVSNGRDGRGLAVSGFSAAYKCSGITAFRCDLIEYGSLYRFDDIRGYSVEDNKYGLLW